MDIRYWCSNIFLGWEHLTDYERKRTFQVAALTFATAGGNSSTSTAVMCNVPFICKRLCYILKDSPPAISVQQDVKDYGVSFSYTRNDGPSATMPDGTVVYLDASRYVPTLNGHCKTEQFAPSRRTETSKMWGNSVRVCPLAGSLRQLGPQHTSPRRRRHQWRRRTSRAP